MTFTMDNSKAGLTLKDVIDYVLTNRRGKAFCGWSEQQIALHFIRGFESNTALYALDNENKIVGVVVCERADDYKVLHVENILTSSRGVMKYFVSVFNRLYPGWDLQATRHENLVRYKNTTKLCKLINSLT